MYERQPTLAEISAAGLTPADFAGQDFEVWPDCWPPFQVFHKMQTQWNAAVGMAGLHFVGLKHEVLFARLDRMNLDHVEYDQIDADVREMELAALGEMNKK